MEYMNHYLAMTNNARIEAFQKKMRRREGSRARVARARREAEEARWH